MKTLIDLTYDECVRLLGAGGVGRVAICTPSGPHIVPVNHAVVGDSVVFRTSPYTVLGTYAWNTMLAFEIDGLDAEYQSGWSVVASGRAHIVEEADELQEIRRTWDPTPWAGGTRQLYVRLRWNQLTGRRTGTGHLARPPVDRCL